MPTSATVSYTHLDVYKRQVLNSYGISSIEEAEKITKDAGLDVYDQVKKIQPICFENACWAYTCLLYTSMPDSLLRRKN